MILQSYFRDLANSASLQFIIDNSLANLEAQSIWRNWLNLAPPQMSLTFDSAIGRERISVAASIVDSDAPAPLRSRHKIEMYKGKIPAIKEKFRMNQDDMRTLAMLRRTPGMGAEIARFLDRDVQEAAVSGDKRVDIMLLQAMSTLTIDVNATNNPDGAVYGVIDLLPRVPGEQLQGVPTIWSNIASTPLTDIDNFLSINYTLRGRSFGRIVMSRDVWLNMKKTTQVINTLATFWNFGASDRPGLINLGTVNEYFGAQGWPQIQVIDHVVPIETDGLPSYYKPFNTNNVSFMPAGKIGTLFNATSMEDEERIAGKSYAKFGPTLLGKWREQDPLVEFTGIEMNAFPSVDVDRIYIMKTDTVQASFI